MEIGGFFEFPDFDCADTKDSVYHYLTDIGSKHEFFRDGRQAIKSVLLSIKGKQIQKCYLPSYMCFSIMQPFIELDLETELYNHGESLKPILDNLIEKSVIFIIDYFGTEYMDDDVISSILERDNIIILDITHSILDKDRFRAAHENLYYISSLRKIFPIPDGGILYHSNKLFNTQKASPVNYEIMIEAMMLKASFLKEQREVMEERLLKDKFLTMYRDYEKRKDNSVIEIQNIPSISLQTLKNINIHSLIEQRYENMKYLYESVYDQDLCLFKFDDIKSPFTFPIIFESRERRELVKTSLIKNDIYPPIHWDLTNFIPDSYSYEQKLSSRILSIPIDQRYKTEELSKVVKVLEGEIQ